MSKEEMIEAYTYLFIDFKNCILSFLSLHGAPGKGVFERYLNTLNAEVVFHCVAITTDEILEKIITKSVLGTIQYKYCTPKEEVSRHIPGVTNKVLNSFNIDRSTVAVSIAPPRKKSVGKDIVDFITLKKALKDTHGDNLLRLSMNAREEDEEMVTYDLLDYKFASFVNIKMINSMTPVDFKNLLYKTYLSQKSVLDKHIFD